MKRRPTFLLLAAAATLVAAGMVAAWKAPSASAQPSASYDLSWHTVDGGGGASSGSGYTLTGTAGQPDAGTLSGASYTLAGGFWAGLAQALQHLFFPLVRR
jgi:hypothetical protein